MNKINIHKNIIFNIDIYYSLFENSFYVLLSKILQTK